MAPIDEDVQVQIQSFTAWAQSKGYHVIGALIGPKSETRVKVFATAPEGDFVMQESHAKKLMAIVNHAMKGVSETSINLPLSTN